MFSKKRNRIESTPEPVDTRDYIGNWGWGDKEILLSSYEALYDFTEKYAFQERAWIKCATCLAVLASGVFIWALWAFSPYPFFNMMSFWIAAMFAILLGATGGFLRSKMWPSFFRRFEGHTRAETKVVLKQLDSLLEEAGTLSTIVHNAKNQGDTHLVESAKHSLLNIRAELNRIAKPYVLEYETNRRSASQAELDDLARSVGLK